MIQNKSTGQQQLVFSVTDCISAQRIFHTIINVKVLQGWNDPDSTNNISGNAMVVFLTNVLG